MAGVDETCIGGGDTMGSGDSVGGGISGIREGQDLAEESVCLHKSWQFKYLIMNFLTACILIPVAWLVVKLVEVFIKYQTNTVSFSGNHV